MRGRDRNDPRYCPPFCPPVKSGSSLIDSSLSYCRLYRCSLEHTDIICMYVLCICLIIQKLYNKLQLIETSCFCTIVHTFAKYTQSCRKIKQQVNKLRNIFHG